MSRVDLSGAALSVVALTALLAACLPSADSDKDSDCGAFGLGCGSYGVYYDTYDYWYDSGRERPDGDVGDFSGVAAVLIMEAGCDIVWDLSGSASNGLDLRWDMDLDLSGSSSCDFGSDTAGTFEVRAGAAYFNSDYWGAAAYSDGSVAWATAGYVYGAGGYTYVYSGSGTY